MAPKKKDATLSKKKQDDLTQILALRDEAIAGYTKHKDDFAALENGLMSIIDEGKRTSLRKRRKSTITPMLIKPKVDTVTRDVLRSFFAGGTIADVQPETVNDEHDIKVAAALMEELRDLEREGKLYSKVKPSIVNTLTYGTVITKVYFDKIGNSVKIEHCKLNEAFLDPKAPSGDDARYLVHRIDSMTIRDLKNKFGANAADWAGYAGDTKVGTNSDVPDSDIGDYQRVEIIEVYRLLGDNWYVTTLIEDKPLKMDQKLKDGLPFIITAIEPQFVGIDESPVRAYGAPFIAPMLPIQKEYVIRRNQQIDAIDMQLNQRFLTTGESGLRDADLNSTRKKLVVTSLDLVRELPAPRIDASIFDVQQLETEAEAISGVSKYSQGMSSEQNKSKTKGEAMILDARGSSVTDDINRAFNENFFRPLITRIILLTYKYKKSVHFAGVSRDKPMKQKIVINVGTGSSNKEVQLQNLDGSLESLGMSFDRAIQVQDMERANKYAIAIDKLQIEKLKLLGQETLVEGLEDDQQQPTV